MRSAVKVIFKALTGSRLFGCSLPDSDYDYKGVYLKDIDELLFDSREVISTKEGNSETTLYSLKHFLTSIQKNKTTELDLLFVPEEHVITQTSEWDLLVSYKKSFLSREATSFFGYSKRHGHIDSNKAHAHCIRVCREAVEYLTTGHITFPRPEKDLLLSIRNDEIPKEVVSEIIAREREAVTEAELQSTYPLLPDIKKMNDLLLEIQTYYVKGLQHG